MSRERGMGGRGKGWANGELKEMIWMGNRFCLFSFGRLGLSENDLLASKNSFFVGCKRTLLAV